MEAKLNTNLRFNEITTASQLISYLDDINTRLKNRKFLYHYTTLTKVIAMLSGQDCYWYLGNAKNMNDMIEYKSGNALRWNNLFFASFMSENEESIGMWSMYSQPWEIGVKIAIPITDMKKWIKNVSEVLEVSPLTQKVTHRKITVENGLKVWLSAVAYSNSLSHDNYENNDEPHKLSWSTKVNNLFSAPTQNPELTGYIKDQAWDYEREIRLKAEFDNSIGFDRVAILIPPELISKMVISSGPLFEGSLTRKIDTEAKKQLRTNKSIFTGKLRIKSACSDCTYKKPSIM